ncbi:unnamed protein product [Mesocestoides corti]|nr:unnamed protein product [Mesocestoides corti]
MHSKKRPHNIVIGRLHDHEMLDMIELGIERYASIRSTDTKLSLGAKPLLIFSGEAFEESEESRHLKSLLIDLFRGPKVTKVNSAGVEHVIHFIMPSEGRLIMRVHAVELRPFQSGPEQEKASVDGENAQISEPLKTPWGPYVQLELRNAAPEADFVIRRCKLPSEDKWKRACRVPSQLRPKTDKSSKNRSLDVFGSKVAQVHVQREHALDELRPAASMRTALTGNVKRGFERQQQPTKKRKLADGAPKAKRQRLDKDNE